MPTLKSLPIRFLVCPTSNSLTKLALAGVLFACTLSNLVAQTAPSIFPPPPQSVSTMPANGDVNPIGVAYVPSNIASGLTIQPYDILVSNFNNSQNLPGTGTTILRVDSHGRTSTFFQNSSPQTGMTSAIGVTKAGLVFAGYMPTADGTSNTIRCGGMDVIDGYGDYLGQFQESSLFCGPWGMAIDDLGSTAHLFLSDVLAGTVVRFDMTFLPGEIVFTNALVIASGFDHRTDPAALVLGPSGLVFDSANGVLYVASSLDNTVYALKGAVGAKKSLGTGTIVYQDATRLHGPTQMALLPNGDLLVANSDGTNADPNQPSELVEFTTRGEFVNQYSVDPNNGGAFGVAAAKISSQVMRFSATDANANTLTTWTEVQ